MGMFRGYEIIILAVIVFLLFGAKRLPDTARSLGKSLRIFKAETTELRRDETPASGSEQPQAPRTIQAAPGDVSQARPASETERTER